MAVGTWAALTNSKRGRVLTSAASGTSTETAPTTDDTYGIECSAVRSLFLILEAVSGQTITGTGTMDCYLYDADCASWVRLPHLDYNLADIPGYTAVRRVALPAVSLTVRRGRIVWIPNTVAVSGGTTFKTYHVADTTYDV